MSFRTALAVRNLLLLGEKQVLDLRVLPQGKNPAALGMTAMRVVETTERV
jgi:hypothetical protein